MLRLKCQILFWLNVKNIDGQKNVQRCGNCQKTGACYVKNCLCVILYVKKICIFLLVCLILYSVPQIHCVIATCIYTSAVWHSCFLELIGGKSDKFRE